MIAALAAALLALAAPDTDRGGPTLPLARSAGERAGVRGQDAPDPESAASGARSDAQEREDAEMLRDLELLERLELLDQLELFDDERR